MDRSRRKQLFLKLPIRLLALPQNQSRRQWSLSENHIPIHRTKRRLGQLSQPSVEPHAVTARNQFPLSRRLRLHLYRHTQLSVPFAHIELTRVRWFRRQTPIPIDLHRIPGIVTLDLFIENKAPNQRHGNPHPISTNLMNRQPRQCLPLLSSIPSEVIHSIRSLHARLAIAARTAAVAKRFLNRRPDYDRLPKRSAFRPGILRGLAEPVPFRKLPCHDSHGTMMHHGEGHADPEHPKQR